MAVFGPSRLAYSAAMASARSLLRPLLTLATVLRKLLHRTAPSLASNDVIARCSPRHEMPAGRPRASSGVSMQFVVGLASLAKARFNSSSSGAVKRAFTSAGASSVEAEAPIVKIDAERVIEALPQAPSHGYSQDPAPFVFAAPRGLI